MLLGDEQLLWTAFQHGAPHHGLGRPLKVGKEEIMGLVAAVEQCKRLSLFLKCLVRALVSPLKADV